MAYIAPHKRNVNAFAVLSEDKAVAAAAVAASATKPAVEKKSYVPPSQRQVDPLAPENFPSLGGSPAKSVAASAAPNFLKRIQEADEERQRQHEAALYNASRLETMTAAQLNREGWELLSLSVAKRPTFVERFNELYAHPEGNGMLDWLEMNVAVSPPRIVRRQLHEEDLASVAEEDEMTPLADDSDFEYESEEDNGHGRR